MPDARRHRGPDPHDAAAFDPTAVPALREAVGDLSWLFSRGYAERSALKLVGDRLSLTERQRNAVRRSACSDEALARRRRSHVASDQLAGQPIAIDGFNLLTTVEAALGGAALFLGRDGALRDLAGVHGTYRKVAETLPALALVGRWLAEARVGPCLWVFDRPISNSGRIKQLAEAQAREAGWAWQVELAANADGMLIESQAVVASADSGIIDRCARWTSLAHAVVERAVPNARLIDLRTEA